MIFIYHYKERHPKETIKIIEEFFTKRHLELRLLTQNISEINTYSCHFGLFFKNQKILGANGKGLTFILAKASGLAELYERFCFFNYIMPIYLSNDSKIQLSNIQLISNQDFISDVHTHCFLNKVLPEINNFYINKYTKIFLNGKLYGVQFQNLIDKKDIQYKNIKTLSFITGSNGLAAGNTLEEALVQGISELYEREFSENFYHNKILQFYKLNLNCLNNQFLEIINILQTKKISIEIYDCSYTYSTPVVLLIAFANNKYFFHSFGAHPVFDIALERCFTELYQGFQNLDQIKKYQNITQYHNSIWTDLAKVSNTHFSSNYGYINENLIINTINVDTFNHNIFLEYNQNIDNKQLLEYIKNINKNNKKIFYYADISLTKQIKTVYIIQKELTQMTILDSMFNIHDYNIKIQQLSYILLDIVAQCFENYININSSISIEQLKIQITKIYTIFSNFDNYDLNEVIDILSDLLSYFPNPYHDLVLTSSKNNENFKTIFFMILDIISNKKQFMYNYEHKEHRLYEIYKLIESYYIQKYPKEKIKKILNWLHYEDVELDFELKDMTPIWYINKIFIEPLYDQYHSQEYYDFIDIFGADK